MIIRQLGPADDPSQAVDLLYRFFVEESFAADRASIARNTKTLASLATCGLFIAEEQGACIGVATVSLEFGIEYGWWAEMGDLYVAPEHRGTGLSRKLLEAVETFLKSRGASGYQVTVTPFAAAHHDLAKFYAKMGFDDEGRVIVVKALR